MKEGAGFADTGRGLLAPSRAPLADSRESAVNGDFVSSHDGESRLWPRPFAPEAARLSGFFVDMATVESHSQSGAPVRSPLTWRVKPRWSWLLLPGSVPAGGVVC